MGTRRKAREAALQLLYGWEFAKSTPPPIELALANYWECFGTLPGAPAGAEDDPTRPVEQDANIRAFTELLLRGVTERKQELDRLIQGASTNWKIERMALVDRNILRIATYELHNVPDIPKKVSLNEAIEIAKRYGSEDSGSFINGILDRISAGVQKP